MYNNYINNLINRNEILAAVLVVQKDGEIRFIKSYGILKGNGNETKKTSTVTLFDLASLTKVVATLPSILLLHQEKELNIDDSIKKYIKDFKYSNVTIRQLLQHTSGLPADLSYKNRNETRAVLEEIIQTNVIDKPIKKVNYSDLGMILLGKIIEKVTGTGLDHFTRQYLFQPWKMNHTLFRPSATLIDKIAPTELFQGRYIHGEVHDEKAFQLGGVSGSAGLFSTAEDLSKYANYWLFPEHQSLLKKETMNLVQKKIIENRGLGFEVLNDNDKELSCGKLWSKGSFGHTGFTGTSVWMDPMEKLSVVFLTNIVQLGREHRMQKIRKELHTLIYQAFVN
ncbi:serine hydrolase domain-containing protein [Virgibacillus sp. W0430]|uniref:serine hydrolase domain-containing protein n=1 Tax=Virgibacillus sp. W0430 TaxID=3391580 RepID=UPI003F48BCE5